MISFRTTPKRKLFIRSVFVGLLLLLVMSASPKKAAAAAQPEQCFKSTGYVNTVVAVRIENEFGQFVKFSDSFSFNVSQFHPWPTLNYPYDPNTGQQLNGIGQDPDGNIFYNDGLRWENNTRAPAFSDKSHNFYVNRDYNSSSLCNVYGFEAPAQVFGDRVSDGHPFLACHYGNHGNSTPHSLGFAFTAGDNWDTQGRVGRWVDAYEEKRPATPDDDINNDSDNVVFVWRYDPPWIPPASRFVVDWHTCQNISGWSYNAFLAGITGGPWTPTDVHIYVDGGPSNSVGWPLIADDESPDLTAASTGLLGFFVNPPPGKGYRWSVNPQATPLAGLDLSVPHTLNFYTPNVPLQNPLTGALLGGTMGARLVATRIMDPAPCPPNTSFNLSATANANFNDDENPNSATLTGTVGTNRRVVGINITCTYTLEKYGGSTTTLGTDSPSNVTVNTGARAADCVRSYPMSNLTAGDAVCITMTASPGSGQSSNTGAISSPGGAIGTTPAKICDYVTNMPYTKAFGGDVRAGVAFQDAGGACANLSKEVKGYAGRNGNSSAVEFAAFATAAIGSGATGQFASAARRSAAPLPPAGLSFANTPSLGGFAYSGCNGNYFNESATMTTTPSATPGSGNVLQKTSGDLTIGSPVTIPASFRQTIYVTGDLIIKSSVSYASYGSLAQIPSLRFVVQGNIYISPGVSQLDGWYISQGNGPTGGTIFTCANVPTDKIVPSAGQLWDLCRTKLTVNGAFTARDVKLLRVIDSLRDGSLGEGSGSERSAEKFVFSAAQWLVAPPRADSTNSVTSAPLFYVTSLPPVL